MKRGKKDKRGEKRTADLLVSELIIFLLPQQFAEFFMLQNILCLCHLNRRLLRANVVCVCQYFVGFKRRFSLSSRSI